MVNHNDKIHWEPAHKSKYLEGLPPIRMGWYEEELLPWQEQWVEIMWAVDYPVGEDDG
jgi:hypothetical protein